MGSITAVEPSKLSGAELDKALFNALARLTPEDQRLCLEYSIAIQDGDEAKALQLEEAIRVRLSPQAG